MTDPTFPTDQTARMQPKDKDLNFADDQVSDTDPDVIEGMARLEAVRAAENKIAEIRPTGKTKN